jgi:hypothetical protein
VPPIYPETVPLAMGHVADNLSLALLSGATVAMYNGSAFLASASTPANGSYMILLPEGYIPPVGGSIDVTLRAWTPAHYAGEAPVTLVRNGTEVVDFALDRFPVVTGTVRNAITLSPVGNAVIEASQGSGVLASAVSDSAGHYTLIATNASAPAPLFLNLTAAGCYRQTVSVGVAKNGSYVQDFFLQMDTVPPTCELALLPTYTTTEVVTLTATASDANGIKELELWYRYDGSGDFEYLAADTSAPFAFEVSTSELMGDGLYEFYCQAVDYADNNETHAAVNDTWTIVDTMAPAVALSALPSYTTTANFTVAAAASDAEGVADVSLYYSWNGSAPSLLGSAALEPYEWTIATASLGGEGLYEFFLSADDLAGNVRAMPTVPDASTFVDTNPPNLTVTAPGPNMVTGQTYVAVSWTCSDTGAGLKNFKVQLDGGAWVNVGSNTTYNLTGLPSGPHLFTVNATDLAGLSTSREVRFLVDTRIPVLTVTSPDEYETLTEADVTVSWAATDLESGISKVQISLDGDLFEDVTSLNFTTFTGLSNGEHNVTIRAYDGVGNYREVTVSFFVSVEKKAGGITTMTIAASAIVIIAVIAIAVVMLLRRRKGGPEMNNQEGPEKGNA